MGPEAAGEDLSTLLPALLLVVYDAFGRKDEAEIYDTLAVAAAGEALETLYLERVGAMVGGGTESDQTIHVLHLVEAASEQSGETFRIDARWQVFGDGRPQRACACPPQHVSREPDDRAGGGGLEDHGFRADRRGPADRRRAGGGRPAVVELEHIAFAYPGGRFRLKVPELHVAPGERLAIVGPSGTGKTTLLNLVAGILRPESGTIRVAGSDLGSLSEDGLRRFRASTIGFVFQDFALLDYLTARENILYPYRITPALKLDAEVRARAEALAGACGLADKLDRRPGALSQGEQQRVAICRALVTRPRS
jgi:putative ABC transport system ATP-binding protein